MELLRFNNEQDAVRAAREVLCQCASLAVAEREVFSLALSGGTSPAPLYRLLAEEGLRVDWRQVRLLQVDERMVPPEDPASNAAMIRATLLAGDDTEDLEFHAMPTLLPGAEAATRYDGLLRSMLGRPDGTSGLDCAVMGMGPDGHTASLFPETGQDAPGGQEAPSTHFTPGTPLPSPMRLAEQDTPNVIHVPNPGMEPLVPRLTLTPELLGRTDTLLFYVNAQGKDKALQRVLQGDPKLPAARLRGRVRTVWIVCET